MVLKLFGKKAVFLHSRRSHLSFMAFKWPSAASLVSLSLQLPQNLAFDTYLKSQDGLKMNPALQHIVWLLTLKPHLIRFILIMVLINRNTCFVTLTWHGLNIHWQFRCHDAGHTVYRKYLRIFFLGQNENILYVFHLQRQSKLVDIMYRATQKHIIFYKTC